MAGENIVSIIVKAMNETGPGFAEAKAEAAGTAEEMDGLTVAEDRAAAKTGLLGDGFVAAGTKLQKFGTIGGIALAGLGYESVKMGMSFQSAMERLVTQAGVAPSKLGALKAGVLDLAGKVGFSPDSLAESLYHVESNFASLGITAPKALALVQIAAEGAKVGNANLEDVTNALTAAVASGIPGVQSFSGAMGALNAIVGAGDMKMQDLAEAMGTGLMAVVKGYGLSLKDVGAALDVFGDNNIRGAHAATDLRMAVQALAVPAAAGKAALASMGLSMTSLADTMRGHGLLAALEELQAHFKAAGVTAQEQGQVITEIFGKKAGVGLAVLMDQMDRLKSKYPAITDGAKGFGKAWGETQQTLTQQWAELRGTFDSLMTALGEKLIPILSAVASFLLKHEGIIKALAPVVMGLVGAFVALSLAMKAIEIGQALMNPWVLGIMAVVVATVLVIKYWKDISKVAKEAWHDAANAVTGAWDTVYADTIAPVVRAFDYIKSFISGNFDSWWKSHGKEIEEVWHVLWTVIRDYFVIEWTIITTYLKAVWDVITTLFKVGMAVVTGIFEVAWDYISTVFKVAWDLIAGVVKIAVAGITSVIKIAWDIIVGIFNVFLDLVTGHWSKAWTDIKTMFEQVWNAIRQFFGSALSDILTALEGAMRAIVSGVRNIIGDMYQAGKEVILALLHGMESMIGGVISTVKGWGHDIANGIGDVFGIHFSEPSEATQMIKAGQNIAAGLSKGMLSGRSAVAAAANQLSGAAGIGTGAGSAGLAGAGGGNIVFQLGGASSGLEQQFWAWFKAGLRAQGGDPRIVTKKVVFQ